MRTHKLVQQIPTAVRILAWVGLLALYAAPCRADNWSPAASMPTARHSLAAAASLDGSRIYAIGGRDDSPNASGVDTVEVYHTSTNTWSTVAPMPTPRWRLAAATGPDGTIYALGGQSGNAVLDTVEAYNPSTNTWSTVAPVPSAREGFAAATGPDGKIYVFGGTDSGGFVTTVEAYDPGKNAWSTVAPMPTQRSNLAAATGLKIYVFGGTDDTGFATTVEAYDPFTNSWSTIAPMPTARASLAAAIGPDGRIYTLGGYTFRPVNAVEAYDPATNTWSSIAPMPTARWGLAAAMGPQGRIYALGGHRNGVDPTILDTVEVYGPSAGPPGTWFTAPPLDVGREALAATTGLDGKIYVLGGLRDGIAQSIVEVYDPSLGQWSSIAPMPTPRAGLAATTGLDGRIYAIGGFNETNSEPLGTVEVYDPATGQWSSLPHVGSGAFLAAATGRDGRIYALGGCLSLANCLPHERVYAYDASTNTWSTVAPMYTERAFLAAVAGSDGRIYAVGGLKQLFSYADVLGSVDAYDPVSDSWTAVASMPTPRMGLAAAVGSDGTIYALGGNNGASTFLDTVEAYDPPTNTWRPIAPMPTARRDLAAGWGVIQGTGFVYAIGGHGVEWPLTTMEVYLP